MRVKTCRISLSYMLVQSFHFYVQIFGLWPKGSKRKTKASGRLSSDSNICSPEGKKPCNTRKVLDEDDQEKQPRMSDKITTQLEIICQSLTSVESRLQNLENIFECFSGLEKSISNFGTELSKLNSKTKRD